jgi:hypothetical protein
VQIYIAPTDKLLNAIKSFVRKWSTSSFLQVLVSSTFTKLQNISHRKQNKNNKNKS